MVNFTNVDVELPWQSITRLNEFLAVVYCVYLNFYSHMGVALWFAGNLKIDDLLEMTHYVNLHFCSKIGTFWFVGSWKLMLIKDLFVVAMLFDKVMCCSEGIYLGCFVIL